MNSKIVLVLLIVVFLTSITFANEATTHCFRQDISRVGTNYNANSISVTNCAVSSGKYDYVCNPDASYKLSSINTFIWTCDNGVTSEERDFAILYEETKSKILKTNSTDRVSGPEHFDYAGCKNIVTGNLCYKDENNYYPAFGTCERGGSTGKGAASSIKYSFTDQDYGENIISAKIAAVSPTSVNAYDPKIMYLRIKGSKKKIFVGSPSMLVFGQEGVQRIGTMSETGSTSFNVFYTLVNRSQFDNTIESYNISCPVGATCTFNGGADKYVGWMVPKESELIISATVLIQNSSAPLKFAIDFDLEFSANGFNDCDPTTEGSFCKTQAVPLEVQLGLLDEQKFQTKFNIDLEGSGCVGLDGIVGQTGESAAPKVNLSFGNGTNPLISVDECNSKDIMGNPNPSGVYCTQAEFLFQVAKRIGEIATIRERIQELESLGKFSEAETLRIEENKYSTFESYLRQQNISEVEETLAKIGENISFFLTNSGLPSSFGTTQIEQIALLRELLTNTTFVQKYNGLIITSTDITPGTYSVKIDLNEIGDVLTSEYLFPDRHVNPSLGLTIFLEKIANPQIDWFFYKSDFNNNLEAEFSNLWDASTDAYKTNIDKRGVLLNFDERENDFSAQLYYETFAFPLFLRVAGDSNGDTNTQMILPLTGNSLPVSFNLAKDAFSYWTGFASSQTDGCDTTSALVTSSFLPHKVPDLYDELKDVFLLNDLSHSLTKVIPNSKLYLETVLYLPYNESVPGNTLRLETPMGVWSKDNSCTGNCTLNMSALGTSHVADSLNTIFEKIETSEICVNYSMDSTQKKNWILFWNEAQILKDLDNKKSEISDATLCQR